MDWRQGLDARISADRAVPGSRLARRAPRPGRRVIEDEMTIVSWPLSSQHKLPRFHTKSEQAIAGHNHCHGATEAQRGWGEKEASPLISSLFLCVSVANSFIPSSAC